MAPARTLAALAVLAMLGACGSVTRLRPPSGENAVPTAVGAQKPETAEELMQPSTQAKPDRQADLLIQSQERQADPFDLPPGPNNGLPANSSSDNAAQSSD